MPDSRPEWRPSATLATLRRRARLLADIRAFFSGRGVLEVETPCLSAAAATAPHLESLPVAVGDGERFLHTSPEFPMKRLLAAGSGDIWQLARVFRGGERGARHNPEFSLLEWYRHGFDIHLLARETCELVAAVAPELVLAAPHTVGYREAFIGHAGIDPIVAGTDECAARGRALGIDCDGTHGHDDWLDLLLTHVVAPRFPRDRLTVLHGYPATQAALARISDDDRRIAERFEIFLGEVELANGFHELADADEQGRRFAAENGRRGELGLPVAPVDQALLAALEGGLPDCSGIALGVDRLLMAIVGTDDISDVLTFAWEIA